MSSGGTGVSPVICRHGGWPPRDTGGAPVPRMRSHYILLPVIELRSYRKVDVPRDIAVQIVSGVRFVWPQFFGKTPPLWETTPYPPGGMHLVMVDGDLLISHVLVTARKLAHDGETFN